MPEKYSQILDLANIDVFLETELNDSSYFDISSLPDVLSYGKHPFIISYKDPNKFGDDPSPWCSEGEWICIGRYAGSRFRIDGGEVRIINDDEVIAKILEPDDIKHV